MWDWFPFVFFPLKILVLGAGMFFSIKWHHDQDKKEKQEKLAAGMRAQASHASPDETKAGREIAEVPQSQYAP
jgi:hypothetical protein